MYKTLIQILKVNTQFYDESAIGSYDASRARVMYLKDFIENKDGYKLFYHKGKPIKREKDLQLLFKLTWFATIFDVNAEVNNGRGPVDFKISKGDLDKTLVEFKLASNSKLKQNIANQVQGKHSKKCTFYTLRFGCSFAAVNTIKPQLL